MKTLVIIFLLSTILTGCVKELVIYHPDGRIIGNSVPTVPAPQSGKTKQYSDGYAKGLSQGSIDGYKDGYEGTYKESYSNAYKINSERSIAAVHPDYAKGYKDGYEKGYTRFFSIGEKEGASDGKEDGGGAA